ncbi:MAG: YbaK/EbsC family protein [Phycisphaerae bacterium]|nr:YbaK/EbsC family protein [Phycisphaerae bacterium]NUQ45278.1 YbaK/EbsC family protein [Phycisphaerae bacterium]
MSLATFLEEKGIRYERHTHSTAYTAQQLAQAEHVSGYIVAKPVIIKGRKDYAMCVVPAPAHVDLVRVAQLLHEPQVRLADEQELSRLFPDCELGAEPPLGTMYGMKTIMDSQLAKDDYLIMQAGTHTEAIKMRRTDFERVCEPMVASITPN